MNKQNLLRAFAIGFLVGSPLVVAAPSISHIDNNHPEKVTIHGSAFGPAPQVIYFDNFGDNHLFPSALSSPFYTLGSPPAGRIIATEADGNRVHKAKDPVRFAQNKRSDAPITILFGQHYQEALIAFSVKTPAGTTFAGASSERQFPSVSSWKFSWLMSTGRGFDDPTRFDVCLPTHTGRGSFSLAGNSGSIGYINAGNEWWDWDNFNHMTSYIKIGETPLDGKSIEYIWSVNNSVTSLTLDGVVPASKFAGTDHQFDRVLIPGWWGNGDNTLFDGVYDNIYVAVGPHAKARVVITDKKQIVQSHYRVTLMASRWTDGEIDLDKRYLPNFDELYIHVFSSDGQKATIAYTR